MSHTFLVERCKIGVAQFDFTRIGRDVAGNAVKQGGFAGTGRPHDTYKFPLLYFQRDSFEYLVFFIAYLVGFVKVLHR